MFLIIMWDSFIEGDEEMAAPVISSCQIKNEGFPIKKKGKDKLTLIN